MATGPPALHCQPLCLCPGQGYRPARSAQKLWLPTTGYPSRAFLARPALARFIRTCLASPRCRSPTGASLRLRAEHGGGNTSLFNSPLGPSGRACTALAPRYQQHLQPRPQRLDRVYRRAAWKCARPRRLTTAAARASNGIYTCGRRAPQPPPPCAGSTAGRSTWGAAPLALR